MVTFREQQLLDLDSIYNTDERGETVAYTPDGGPSVSIDGIFRNSYVNIDPITGESASVEPTFTTKTSNVPNAKHKDLIVVDPSGSPVTYGVVRVMILTSGRSKLLLLKE